MTTSNEAFARLNAAQREAATFGEPLPQRRGVRAGPLLMIAGAGTGKTNTLAHRVAHLVLEGVAPERILLLTFTRRAAVEMTRRAQRVVAEACARHAAQARRTSASAAVVGHLPFDRQPPAARVRGDGSASTRRSACSIAATRPT